MDQIHDRVAGLDVHRDSVAVGADARAAGRYPHREGAVSDHDLRTQPAGWLAEREVALVAMEATGVYWKAVHYALEARFEVWLCNAHHVKNVPGRKRTTCPTRSGWPTSPPTGWCARASCRPQPSGHSGS